VTCTDPRHAAGDAGAERKASGDPLRTLGHPVRESEANDRGLRPLYEKVPQLPAMLVQALHNSKVSWCAVECRRYSSCMVAVILFTLIVGTGDSRCRSLWW
jgi:hypothetical protein